MTPEQCQKKFSAFTQAESSTTNQYGGTGLGLTISKKFAEIMSGNMAVTTEHQVGTTFTLTIPTKISSEFGDEAG